MRNPRFIKVVLNAAGRKVREVFLSPNANQNKIQLNPGERIIDALSPEAINAESIPHEVPLWAFRAILISLGYKDAIEAMLDKLSEPEKTVVNQQWEYGNFIVRTHPLIEQFGKNLGLSNNDIDTIFIDASKLH